MLFNEKALDLLKEQFDINDSENEDSLTYLKVAKTQVNHFMYLARIFKREEAYEQFKKYERIYMKCIKDDMLCPLLIHFSKKASDDLDELLYDEDKKRLNR